MDDKKIKIFIKRMATVSIIMIFISLALGVYYREFARFILKDLSFDEYHLVARTLANSHGHTLLLGAIIPAFFILLTYIFRNEITERKYKSLNTAFIIYLAGMFASLILMVIKGSSLMLTYMETGKNFEILNDEIIFGHGLFRIIIYSVSHIVFAVGTVWYLIAILKIRIKPSNANFR